MRGGVWVVAKKYTRYRQFSEPFSFIKKCIVYAIYADNFTFQLNVNFSLILGKIRRFIIYSTTVNEWNLYLSQYFHMSNAVYNYWQNQWHFSVVFSYEKCFIFSWKKYWQGCNDIITFANLVRPNLLLRQSVQLWQVQG